MPVRIEEALAAVGTGVWRWDTESGEVRMDAEAARLLGLPPDRTMTTSADVRSRFHVVDYVELKGVMALALAEGNLAEALLRVVDEQGDVVRTVRSRMRP